MNHYFNQLIMYHEIHQQKRTGKQPSQIASFLGMDTRTIKKYLARSKQEFDAYQVKLEQRTRRLAEYEDFVHRRLADCTEASSAQVHDWLKECHPDFEDVSIKCTCFIKNGSNVKKYNFLSENKEDYIRHERLIKNLKENSINISLST